MPYLVFLTDAPTLAPAHRVAAEIRYITVLEQQLGGAASVEPALRASLAAEATEPGLLPPPTRDLAARWLLAAESASEAGLQEVGMPGGAHFAVRVE